MSHDFRGSPGAALGGRHAVPPLPSAGAITVGVKLLIVGGVLLSIMQGMFVGMSSGFGRVWPSEASAKVVLPPSNF